VVRIMVRVVVSIKQGCSFGLERLGLEAVSRRFLGRLGLVSVLKMNVSVSSRS